MPLVFRMARVEPHQFAVGDQVEAGQFLRLEHRHHGIAHDEARRVADHPGEHRITADDRRLDASGHERAMPFQSGRGRDGVRTRGLLPTCS